MSPKISSRSGSTAFPVDDVTSAAKPIWTECLTENLTRRFMRKIVFLPEPALPVINEVYGRLVLLFDGAGLGLFAVAGTQKALIAGLNPVMAIFMGVLTGIGGGILRDVLVNQTPTVLQADIYAVAALAAGVVVVIGCKSKLN